MKITTIIGLMALTLSLPCFAQNTPSNVSIKCNKLPVALVLKSMFVSHHLKFLIDENVNGFLTASIKDVPFDTALNAIASAERLTYTFTGNIYHVSVKPIIKMSSMIEEYKPSETLLVSQPDTSKRFYSISVNHQDAYALAIYLSQVSGVILVPADNLIPNTQNSNSPNITSVGGNNFNQNFNRGVNAGNPDRGGTGTAFGR